MRGDSLTRLGFDICRRCSACGREILLLSQGWTSHHRSARGGEILLLSPGWTSLVVIRHAVGRFSYSPPAGHLSSSFGAWWGDSLTRPMLNISHRHSARGGEILLFAPCWTSLIIIRCEVGRFSYSPHAGHLSLSFDTWWGDSLTHPRLYISRGHSARGGEILLLAPGWTSCLLYTSPSPRDSLKSRMPSSA